VLLKNVTVTVDVLQGPWQCLLTNVLVYGVEAEVRRLLARHPGRHRFAVAPRDMEWERATTKQVEVCVSVVESRVRDGVTRFSFGMARTNMTTHKYMCVRVADGSVDDDQEDEYVAEKHVEEMSMPWVAASLLVCLGD
jgi:hypothetical protein